MAIYGVEKREVPSPKGTVVREKFCVVRLADGVALAQHNEEADALEQAAALEGRAARAVA